jgi:threonine dehydrogenase-like Zn-dependent dehydrogenase
MAMKAAFRKGREVSLRDTVLRALKPGEIRVRVTACGICGTDLHDNPQAADRDAPFGHEVAGTILEISPDVPRLQVGQTVALDSATPCGRCDSCRNARQELCTDIQSFWFTQCFGFAEEMIVPAVCAIPCPDLPPDVACLQEPLGVAIDLVRLADIEPTSNVLVFGADRVVDPSATPLDKIDFGCPIDRVLVTTPPPTLADAFSVAAKGAIVSFIGIAYGENAFCRFDANAFHFKKLQLRASFASPALYGALALQYLREGLVNGPALISHRFPLSQIAEAMAVARDPAVALKVVVMP